MCINIVNQKYYLPSIIVMYNRYHLKPINTDNIMNTNIELQTKIH